MALTLAMPFTVSTTGALMTLVQDSPAEVSQSVVMLLSTIIGERTALPGYGITDPLGENIVDDAEIAQAIATWDDRVDEAEIESIISTVNGAGVAALTVSLSTAGADSTANTSSIPGSFNETTDGVLDGGAP